MSNHPGTDELTPDAFRAGLDEAFAGEPPAPDAATYVSAGRRRLTHHRSVIVAACALAVVAVPVSITAVTGARGDGGDDSVAADTPRAPEGWRLESSGGVSFAVPPDWAPGNLSQWCVNSEGPPTVDLPGRMGSTLVGCYPTYGYGAVLAPRAPTMDWHLAEPYRYHATSGAETLFPEGAWVAQAETGGGLLLTVVTESRATTEQVIGSLRTD